MNKIQKKSANIKLYKTLMTSAVNKLIIIF